jgi:hypothetical protein
MQRAAACAVALWAAGCAENVILTQGPGTGGDLQGGAAGDGGSAGAGGAEAESFGGSGVVRQTSTISFSGSFQHGRGTCTETVTFGACVVSTCVGEADLVLGGALRMTAEAFDVTLTPNDDKQYHGQSLPEEILDPGDLVHAVGGGNAEVPAFDLGVTVPALLTDVLPAVDPLVWNSGDVPFSWSGGGDSQVVVYIGTEATPAVRTQINCTAPASAGELVIPDAALAMLPHEPTPILGVYVRNEQRVRSGTWELSVAAINIAKVATVSFP